MSYIDLKIAGRVQRVDLPQAVYGARGERIELRRPVQQGSNGLVLEASRYDAGGRFADTCAVKVLKALDDTRVDRFRNEIRVLKELHHDGIASYHADGSIHLGDQDVPWVAMELGGEHLRRHVEAQGALAKEQLIDVLQQMAAALEHLHGAGFIHRDVKPENFVWETTRAERVLMIDFGIAKRIGEDVSARPLDNFTRTSEFVGPVFFSSPELIAYGRDKTVRVDQRSDIFQLAKVAWFLATGTISVSPPLRVG